MSLPLRASRPKNHQLLVGHSTRPYASHATGIPAATATGLPTRRQDHQRTDLLSRGQSTDGADAIVITIGKSC